MSHEIKLPENLTIHHIETYFNELNTLFDGSDDEVNVNASGVETIDTAGLQTLLILVAAAIESGKTIRWSDPSEVLESAAKKLGLTQALLLN